MGSLKLTTASSGSVILSPANTASDTTMTVPAANGTIIYSDASGNVGIGTSSPSQKLQIVDGRIALTEVYDVRWLSSGGTLRGSISADSGSNLYFATGSSNTERMRINSAGLLLQQTTATVSGFSAWYTINASTGLNNIGGIAIQNGNTTYGTSSQFLSFINSAGNSAGAIQHTAVTTTAYATSSDARLKENITDAPDALEKVNQVKVRSFDWKEDGHHVDYGFIAQELENTFSEAVCKGDDGEVITDPKMTWQVEYGRLTPMLVKAIQEQQAIITDLKARIETLENK